MQENCILRALNFKFSWGSMPPNPPSQVGANHSCKILDPPLRYARHLNHCCLNVRLLHDFSQMTLVELRYEE